MSQTPPPQRIRLAAVTRKPDGTDFEQRVLRYRDRLDEQGISVQAMTLPTGSFSQRRLIGRLGEYDGLWWHRHRVSWPGLRLLRRTARRLVFDFSDPVSYSAGGGGRRSISRARRFARMLRCCDAAFAGNGYLRDLARPYCDRVEVIPMAIDAPPDASSRRPTDGPVQLLWLGSPATQSYLQFIRRPLEQLGQSGRNVVLRLVAHQPMTFGKLRVDFRRWSPAEQEAALRQCHVGLCPMPDTLWTRGKCPFKVIQYMAWGLPWVGSAVGENLTTAGEGSGDRRGLCAATESQWTEAIEQLIDRPEQRQAMGRCGIAYIARHHARPALADRLATLWREIVTGPPGRK